MFRFYALVLIFCFSSTVFSTASENISAHQWVQTQTMSVVTTAEIKPKHAQLMPTSMAILLIAIGFALVFLDDHLTKSKNRKK